MKKNKSILILTLLMTTITFSQTQEKIPWPSLADSPWPLLRADVQGTKRSIFVGPKTPNVIWRKTYPTGIINGPVIDETGKLYFGSRANYGYIENYFYCADETGEELWKFKTLSFAATDSAPLVSKDGTIYFASQNSYFYALNPNGSLKWEYKSRANFFLNNMVADLEGNIYAINQDSLFCFSPNGRIKFKLEAPSAMGSSLVFSPSGDRLYMHKIDGYSKSLIAVNLSGEIVWEKVFKELVGSSTLVDNFGRIYIMGEELNNPEKRHGIICLDENGDVLWISDHYKSYNKGSPTIDRDGNITYPVYKGIASIDYEGNPRWIYNFEIEDWFTFDLEEVIHSLICDNEGTLYAGSSLGNYFYAIDQDGNLLWKLRLDGQFSSAPSAIGSDGTLYIGLSYGFDNFPAVDNLIAIKDNPNSVKEEELPNEYKLEQNYPNPFNPSTTIKFSIPKVSEVKLSIYNLLGQEIETLFHGEKEAGSYEYVFENKSLSTGVYFYVLESQQIRLSRKMMLIK